MHGVRTAPGLLYVPREELFVIPLLILALRPYSDTRNEISFPIPKVQIWDGGNENPFQVPTQPGFSLLANIYGLQEPSIVRCTRSQFLHRNRSFCLISFSSVVFRLLLIIPGGFPAASHGFSGTSIAPIAHRI